MKTNYYKPLTRCISIALFLCLAQNEAKGNVIQSIQFSRSDISFVQISGKDGIMYIQPEMEGLGKMSEIGKPCLPVKYIKLLIPADQDVESIQFLEIEEESLTGKQLIFPAQPPVPLSDGYPIPDFASLAKGCPQRP